MPRVSVDYRDYFRPIAEGLQKGGLLLVATDGQGRANPITIGWAALGPIWGRSIFMAMVRPSRFTYGFLERSGDFTVNLLPKGMAPALALCGTKSGRDLDKLAAAGLTVEPSESVVAPTISGAALTLECRVVERTDLDPQFLDPAVRQSGYPQGDFHRLFFGEIVRASADPKLLGR